MIELIFPLKSIDIINHKDGEEVLKYCEEKPTTGGCLSRSDKDIYSLKQAEPHICAA